MDSGLREDWVIAIARGFGLFVRWAVETGSKVVVLVLFVCQGRSCIHRWSGQWVTRPGPGGQGWCET